MKSLQAFICQIAKLATNNNFIAAYRNKASYFSRSSAKLTFDKLLLFMLTLPRQSAQCALNRFIKERGYDFSLHKQSLFEAREKLSHRVFIDLNNDFFLRDYAYSDTFKTQYMQTISDKNTLCHRIQEFREYRWRGGDWLVLRD